MKKVYKVENIKLAIIPLREKEIRKENIKKYTITKECKIKEMIYTIKIIINGKAIYNNFTNTKGVDVTTYFYVWIYLWYQR